MENLDPIPNVGDSYPFFDDGKLSRLFFATVTRVISPEEAKKITFDLVEYEDWDPEKHAYRYEIPYTISLYDIQKGAVQEHTQGKNFKVIGNHAGMEEGDPWLYARETDKFIECTIPEYDDNPIWFVRTVWGGWFSMDIQSSWQGGMLDVTGKQYEKYKEVFNEYK